ncbi:flagellar hook-basal body complex protein FliE [Cryobacterium frigoriphilum]|uniref:Flagellar hook-basal body complex protein FliE n=1 Tax=Cryobacterium frigoriphilum TaxID=1259150 RepID=A0A4R8ZVB2_9MICO|nr:flagellar hook-basal body complex protein FliE [Cryobacterium frigoriphilum]TFD47266.1 flagellar hook-basal body complex protein FliE [Cryobacterium frigoriphilum]
MPFSAISMVSSVAGTTGVAGTTSIASTQGTQDSGASFGVALAGAVENVQTLQNTSNGLALNAIEGGVGDIAAATIASTEAQVTLELVAAIRNKGIDAFTEIMRMQA